MFNRITHYLYEPDEPLPLMKLGFGVGFGWFTAQAIVRLIVYFVVQISAAVQ